MFKFDELRGYELVIVLYKEDYNFPISAVDMFSSDQHLTVYETIEKMFNYINKSNLHLAISKHTFGNVFFTRYKLFCKEENIKRPHIEEIKLVNVDTKNKVIRFKILVK